MSAQEIDEYLDGLDEPKRTTLTRLRQTIIGVLPDADQGISYGLPLPAPLVRKLISVRLRQAFPA
jgi:uncharacterized protein YdhG (YjbR/CyaY superfamily)